MVKATLLFSLLLAFSSLFAQKKGIVINESINKPIPFVNIHIAGTQTGFTSDLKGRFLIEAGDKDSIVFSAVGYKRHVIIADQLTKLIKLTPVTYDIPEITISEKEKKKLKIGALKRQFPGHHFGINIVQSYMVARFFPFKKKYTGTPFFKSIEFLTQSDVKDAKFNIRLYEADSNGQPGGLINSHNIIGIARKGDRKTKIDLEHLHIQFPHEGLFVAVEWLNIEANKYEYTYTRQGSRKKHKGISTEPSFSLQKDTQEKYRWIYLGNGWENKLLKIEPIQMEIALSN